MLMKSLKDKLDDKYHGAILNSKLRQVVGKEEKFQKLGEVLGFLHKRKEYRVGDQI